MGSQLRWLERAPDKREVDGSSPFEPTSGERPAANNQGLSSAWLEVTVISVYAGKT